MYHIPRLSEVIYVGLSYEVGTPTEVRMRRGVTEIMEAVKRPVYIRRGLDRIMSGSQREGFKLRTSDFDLMLWPPDHKVICDPSQISLYRIPQHTVILMECDDLPPGFTRLKLMSQSNDTVTNFSFVVMGNNIYISSTLLRDNNLRFLKTSNFPPAVPHGPCSTFIVLQHAETDYALCFQSHHWPTSAFQWIQRCDERGWPDQNIVSDILSGGFHVVPIGSKPENELEWRISFSQAEKKIVHSMNHCQFLCYGLFKFFLKEVINCQPNTSVLCSYFIKTIVFWVIQKNTPLSWTPDNLLLCFWESFKLLIYMVYTGECPNFFIPQNNMFRVKVTGSVQTSLFSQLYDLYCKGMSCLLLSETIRPCLSIAILNRTSRIPTHENSILSTTQLDISLFRELYALNQEVKSTEDFAVYMRPIESLIRKRLTSYETVSLQCITSNVLRNIAMYLERLMYQNETRNKVFYKVKVYTLLKQSCKFGSLSDILYLAMYVYRKRSYDDSLSCLHKAHDRMSLPYIVYDGHVNVEMYRHYMERNTPGTKMRRAVVRDIKLYCLYTYIDELALEQKISKNHFVRELFIPPLVVLYMLFILNHHRLGDTVRSQQSLQDLQTLLLYDDGGIVYPHLRDISWQILGICQQICGDYSGSLQSYRHSLQQIPIHNLHEATLLRINTLSNAAM